MSIRCAQIGFFFIKKNWRKTQRSQNGCRSNVGKMWKLWILSNGNVWSIRCHQYTVLNSLLFTNDNQLCTWSLVSVWVKSAFLRILKSVEYSGNLKRTKSLGLSCKRWRVKHVQRTWNFVFIFRRFHTIFIKKLWRSITSHWWISQ